jgi:Asp-tRNA(Asn)/Glu-tRNA(Gln) amidotransferase A subunit family amidase
MQLAARTSESEATDARALKMEHALAMEELLPQGTVLCLPTAPCPALPCDASTVSAASIWRVE